MIRALLSFLYFVLWLIFSIPAAKHAEKLGKSDPEKQQAFVNKKVNSCLKGMKFLAGTRVTCIGAENIPDTEPVLYVGNHRSFYDVLLTYPYLKGHAAYVGKKELEKTPLLGWWMKLTGCIFLDRDNVREALKTILDGITLMKNGQSLFIFPEGTRNRGEELSLLPFKEGSMKLALKSKSKIVPVSINNAASIFEKQFPLIRRAHVVIEFGTPVDPQTLSREQQTHLGETLRETIDTTLHNNASLV